MVNLHHFRNHRHGREYRRVSPYTDFILELFLEKQEVFFGDVFSTTCGKAEFSYDSKPIIEDLFQIAPNFSHFGRKLDLKPL